MPFVIEPFCNAFLPRGERRVDVILKVRAMLGPSPATAPLHYGILIDCSGSMREGGKMAAAKIAARAAISRIPDGVMFFIVAFDDAASVVVPSIVASDRSRAEADRAVASIDHDGGTSMAQALIAADRQFGSGAGVRVCQLFTDGANGDERGVLERTLKQVKGRFQCECRGIGVDWQPAQLLQIAEALLGTAKGVATGEAMAADLHETFAAAAGRRASDVKLRLVVPPKMASVAVVEQMSPTIIDVTGQGIAVDDRTYDYPTGAWADEERDYRVVLDMKQAGSVGEQLRVARTAIVIGNHVEEQPAITVTWSDDDHLTTLIDPHVAHYSGQAELAEATREGFEALGKGNSQLATLKLGRALALAKDSGNEEATRRLGKIVDVVDPTQGTVRLRAGIQKTDLLDAEVGATRTVRRAPAKTA